MPLSVPCTGNVCTNNDASYPIVAGGRVFVTSQIYHSQAVVFALDQETGQTLWGPVGADGTVTIYNSSGATHVVADAQGWVRTAG